MSLRTPEQYIQSLRDGRTVYYKGEKVEDITEHPVLKVTIEQGKMDYVLPEDPKFRDLFVENDEDGEPVSFVYIPDMSREDLLRRRDIIQASSRTCFGLPSSTKFTGIDGLYALNVISERIDKQLGDTEYHKRVTAYAKMLQKEDPALSIGMSDVKGDRTLRPSQQVDPDLYLRVVETRPEGIVVRGAKTHVTLGLGTNEILITPCRAMKEDDKDYAVAFAVPLNIEGLTIVCSTREAVDEGNFYESPIGASLYSNEATFIFNDVLVPWERVFMNGEWQYCGQLVYMFGNFHRASADAYKYAELELLLGAAALMAEYNGIEKASHIKDKLTWMTMYVEATEALGLAACYNCVTEPGTQWVHPDPMYSNISKHFFADNFHQALKYTQDITGAIAATSITFDDYFCDDLHDLLDKYFVGKAGIPTENRLKAVKLVKDLSSCFNSIATLHAEGSLLAQELSIYTLSEFDRYKAAAKRAANIDDGTGHPVFDVLPKFPSYK